MRRFQDRWRVKVALVAVALACGCQSARRSYRYGDGSIYDGIDGIKLSQKFFVRSLEFKNTNAHLPADTLAKHVPELLSAECRDGDIPINVVVRYGGWKAKPQFLYSTLSLLTLTIVPREGIWEDCVDVDILSEDGEKVVPSTSYLEDCREKTSYLLPFGGISYGVKEGFQYNFLGPTLSIISADAKHVDMFAKCVSCCVAQQLKKHALDRVTTPTIDFGEDKK